MRLNIPNKNIHSGGNTNKNDLVFVVFSWCSKAIQEILADKGNSDNFDGYLTVQKIQTAGCCAYCFEFVGLREVKAL